MKIVTTLAVIAMLLGTVSAIAQSLPKPHRATQATAPDLVRYVPLAQLGLTNAQRAEWSDKLMRLERTGSASGGELTDEFKKATHAKMNYRFGRKQALSFAMSDVKFGLPQGFVLTGREYLGEQSPFDGLYRLFENPSTKGRLELFEYKILASVPRSLVKEWFNKTMDSTPVHFETLLDKKGVRYYKGELVCLDRHVFVVSKGMSEAEFWQVIKALVKQA